MMSEKRGGEPVTWVLVVEGTKRPLSRARKVRCLTFSEKKMPPIWCGGHGNVPDGGNGDFRVQEGVSRGR